MSRIRHPEQQTGKEDGNELRQRPGIRRPHVFDRRIVGPERIDGFDKRGAKVRTKNFFYSRAAAVAIGSSAFMPGKVSIDSRITPIRIPLRDPVAPDIAAFAA